MLSVERKTRKMKNYYILHLPCLDLDVYYIWFSKESGGESSSLSLTVTQKIVDIIDFNDNMSEEEYEHMVSVLHTPRSEKLHICQNMLYLHFLYMFRFCLMSGSKRYQDI